jgi:hypothetical protein
MAPPLFGIGRGGGPTPPVFVKWTTKLRARLAALDEDRFIIHVLQPLLQRMGFERVRAVAMHGQGEFGADIGPFRHMTPFGTVEY